MLREFRSRRWTAVRLSSADSPGPGDAQVQSMLEQEYRAASCQIAIAPLLVHSATPADGQGPLVARWPPLHAPGLRIGPQGCAGHGPEVYRELPAALKMERGQPIWCTVG